MYLKRYDFKGWVARKRNDSHFNSHSGHSLSHLIAQANGRIDAVEAFMPALLTEMETFASVAFYSW